MKLQKVSGTYSLPYVIRTEWTTYLIFSIIYLPIAVLYAYLSFANPSAWRGLLVALVFLSAFLIWAGSFKILVKEDRLIYSTLLSRNNEARFSDIKKLKIGVGLWKDEEEEAAGEEESASEAAGISGKIAKEFNKAIESPGIYRFNIYTGSYGKPLTINMKPFSKRDLAILADAIVTKAPGAKTDELTQQLKEGNFKPISSEGIRKMWQIFLWMFWMFLIFTISRALIM